MLIRGSPTQGVLKTAWLPPLWRGSPNNSTHSLKRSANFTLRGLAPHGFESLFRGRHIIWYHYWHHRKNPVATRSSGDILDTAMIPSKPKTFTALLESVGNKL